MGELPTLAPARRVCSYCCRLVFHSPLENVGLTEYLLTATILGAYNRRARSTEIFSAVGSFCKVCDEICT